MSPADARLLQVAAEIERDWSVVVAHLGKAKSVEPTGGEAPAALVALSLDHAYQAFETLLSRLERALGLPERSGAAWHLQLLADAGAPISGLRPAAFPPHALADWEALLRFRHFLRHAYVLTLDATKLQTNVERLERAVAGSAPSIAALIQALRTP